MFWKFKSKRNNNNNNNNAIEGSSFESDHDVYHTPNNAATKGIDVANATADDMELASDRNDTTVKGEAANDEQHHRQGK